MQSPQAIDNARQCSLSYTRLLIEETNWRVAYHEVIKKITATHTGPRYPTIINSGIKYSSNNSISGTMIFKVFKIFKESNKATNNNKGE